jgi:hypothetical protein
VQDVGGQANERESSSNDMEEMKERKQSEVYLEISKINEQVTNENSLSKNNCNEILKSEDQ